MNTKILFFSLSLTCAFITSFLIAWGFVFDLETPEYSNFITLMFIFTFFFMYFLVLIHFQDKGIIVKNKKGETANEWLESQYERSKEQ